jgi:hypothetical protein
MVSEEAQKIFLLRECEPADLRMHPVSPNQQIEKAASPIRELRMHFPGLLFERFDCRRKSKLQTIFYLGVQHSLEIPAHEVEVVTAEEPAKIGVSDRELLPAVYIQKRETGDRVMNGFKLVEKIHFGGDIVTGPEEIHHNLHPEAMEISRRSLQRCRRAAAKRPTSDRQFPRQR